MTGASGRPVVIAIGGSDCSGMAGIQMDQRVIQALGCHAATVVSANTAQNSSGVISVNPVTDSAFVDQLKACRDLAPAAIKIGLLATAQQVRLCAEFVAATDVPAVVDPVIASSSGVRFSGEDVVENLRRFLLPRSTLVTPNLLEAAHIGQGRISSAGDIVAIAATLHRLGAAGLVVKGGHSPLAQCSDYCVTRERSFWLVSERCPVANTRGTGCTFASAAAAALAMGYGPEDAAVIAKMAVNQGLRQGYACAGGQGPVGVTDFPGDGGDLPVLADRPATLPLPRFPSCGPEPLGLYPVVDRSHWLERLLPLGVSTIQLRIKKTGETMLREEIGRAVALSRKYGARLFVNDHWSLALEYGAYGVHLGQEDLDGADLDAISHRGLRLGVSTHCHYEVARAIGVRPSYLACGPVYATTTKTMPWEPQGLEGLGYWRRTLANYPLVAIGGINGERLGGVAETGVDGIAMVTAITRAADPEGEMRRLHDIISSRRR